MKSIIYIWKKVYENIKENMSVPKDLKTEKFSIINDILKFISNYNKNMVLI